MIKVSPSILTANFCELGGVVRMLEKAGADWIHLDVMDGIFVPNLTFGQKVVKDMRPITTLPLDAHLMVADPRPLIPEFAAAGADIITVHAESAGCTHLHRVLHSIRELGKKAGVSLNPATPIEALEYVYDEADLILIMSVNPGFGGQKFIPQTLRKIEAVANRARQLGVCPEIEVDGGVNEANCRSIADAGATVLVAGHAVVDAADPAKAIKTIRGEA